MEKEQEKTNYLYSDYKYIWKQLHNSLDSIYPYIQNHHVVMDDYGNITVTNSDVEEVPAFCCHLDTIHTKEPDPELIKNDILISLNGGGIGGDDKCGIIACLELINSGIPCKVIFFRDEESGCKGSGKYDAKSLAKNKYLIEIDRKGGTDLIFKSGSRILCDDKFKEEIISFFPHGEEAHGIMTDVNVLGDAGINMLNISAGYYNPHHNNEYVVLSELERNIECLKFMAQNYGEGREYKREEEKYESYRSNQTSLYESYGNYPTYWGQYNNDNYDMYGQPLSSDTESYDSDDAADIAWYKSQYGEQWKKYKDEDDRYMEQLFNTCKKGKKDKKKTKNK